MVRETRPEDYDIFARLQKSRYYGSGEDADRMIRAIWDTDDPEASLWLTVEEDGRTVGFLHFGRAGIGAPSIGIDILDEWMDRGFGQKAVGEGMQWMREHFQIRYFRWECDRDNEAAVRIAGHFGGVLTGTQTIEGYEFSLYNIQ